MQESCKQQAAQGSTCRQADSEGRVPHSLISSIRKAPLPAVEFPVSPSYSRLHTPASSQAGFPSSLETNSVISFTLMYLLFIVLLFDCTILSVYSVVFLFFCRLKRVQDGIMRFLLCFQTLQTLCKYWDQSWEQNRWATHQLENTVLLVINSPKIQSTEPEVSLLVPFT